MKIFTKNPVTVLMIVFISSFAGMAGAQEYDYYNDRQDYYEDGNYASRVRIALHGGWSYRAAKVGVSIPPSLIPYMEELKKGYNLGGNATYYFREKIGTGLKLNIFRSDNKTTDETYGFLKNKISIIFAGPTIGTRLLDRNKRHSFITNLGLGYLGYFNSGQDNTAKLLNKKGTFGLALDIGYDIGLSPNIALGLQVSFLTGNLKSLKTTKGDFPSKTVPLKKGDYENLTTINLSAGIRFNFGKVR